jgi:hypothetical protein
LIAERENKDDNGNYNKDSFGRSSPTAMHRRNSQSYNASDIDNQVYKYQIDKFQHRNSDASPTPRIAGFLRGTATSFNMTRPPAFVELRKLETTNQIMP